MLNLPSDARESAAVRFCIWVMHNLGRALFP
jgi:hypothetical protein